MTKINRKIIPTIQGDTIKCDIVFLERNNSGEQYEFRSFAAKNLTLLEHVLKNSPKGSPNY